MRLDRNLDDLPTLRSSKLRLLSILEDDNVDIKDVERIIASDPAMAAKMVRLANSAFYRHSKQAQSIHDAIMTIGFDMVRCISLSMSVMQTFSSNQKIARDIWRHCFAVGVTAMAVGKSKDERGTFFSGGLLHDLGRVVLIWKEPVAYTRLFQDGWPDLQQEQEVFEMDHTVIGEFVAQRWHFPAEVIEIIKYHHAPINRASSIISLVDYIVHNEENGQRTGAPLPVAAIEKHLGQASDKLIEEITAIYKQNAPSIEELL
jgi:HD-like signal output (HDOD) protein